MKEKTTVSEGMSVKDEISGLLGGTPSISIENMNDKRLGLPLREYCIKASYNSAYSGSTISDKMVKYVLSKGCRFLDLQIHYSDNDNLAYVANITDPKIKEMESVNRVPLDTIFNVITANAFIGSQGSDGCPNPKDPLFIHLRIIPDKYSKVYKAVSECITKNFPNSSRFLDNDGKAKKIDKYTQINSAIMKKTMFLIDKTYNPEYAYFSQTIANLMNGETGGSTFQMQDYGRIKNKVKTSPMIKDDFKTTNILEEQIIIPDVLEQYSRPSIIDMVVNYGVQITMYSFYKSDDKLTQYEDLFNQYKSSIIPMAYAINYLGKMETELATKKLQLGSFA
uniref:Phosphatidylinositol-specific phospholipase C X domain-containing protein n=1 Tax=viral metagenome TaxID=1070528 RepID=A0A6C0JW88_9ZZZZ